MRIVVADTSPIRYLVVIGEIEVLPALFGKVIIPTVVRDELAHLRAPEAVRTWIQTPPLWLEPLVTPASPFDSALENLDAGERAALVLAASLSAELILLDDREGARVALEKGFSVMGTLGEAAKATGARLSDYVRERLFRRGTQPAVAAGVRRNPETKALLDELRRIGNNLNQLTHHANAVGMLREERELRGTITQLKAAMERVLGL